MTRTFIQSDEASWQGHERIWAHMTLYPPKKFKLPSVLDYSLKFIGGCVVLIGVCAWVWRVGL